MSTYAVWGWGEAEPTDLGALAAMRAPLAEHLGFALQEPERPAPLPELPADRVSPRLPAPLRALASADPMDRARHALGRSYLDVVAGLRGVLPRVPDAVLRPGSEAEVVDVLDWCSGTATAVIPFGGGTSVVGGVDPDVGDGFRGVVSLDLGRLAGVRAVDRVSGAADVAAGTTGPRLERELRAHGLTARFYPQSFERSTVGGWVATRAAGHFSSGPTHVDDLVEAVRLVTPSGTWESRRLPGSGAGPSPDRLVLGSEGALGVVTSAWLRVQPRPGERWSATLAAPEFAAGTAAVRSLLQQGVTPATCRLLDPVEAATTGTLPTGEAALVLGLESLGAPLGELAAHVLAVGRAHGLRVVEAGARGAAGETWRSSFVRAPYLREQLVLLGCLVETFETAVTWDRLDAFVADVRGAAQRAVAEVCGAGRVSCRLTHVYRDGAAPYFTVLAPARRGSEASQWREIKAAATEVILAAGGTVTHHHAVGREHRRWYDAQRPDPFARALVAAKAAVDPAGVCNPGVLVG